MIRFWRKITNSDLFLPSFLIIILAAIAYLPFIGRLGFYRDDWYAIWAATTQGPSMLIKMFSIDRPFMGFLYALTSKILGGNLLGWHLFAFCVRVINSFIFYWIIKMLWPQQKVPLLLMAALFTIYPGFLQQTNANTFQNHLIGYGLSLISIAFSIRVFLSKTKILKLILTLLALISGMAYLLIYEYMIGMEMVRICLFGLLFLRSNPKLHVGKLLSNSLKQWLPYLTMTLVFFFWRFFIFKSTRATTDISGISALFIANPIGVVLKSFSDWIFGGINSIFLAWSVPLYKLVLELNAFEFMLGLLLVCLAGVIVYILILKIQDSNDSPAWQKQAMLIGLISVFVTLLPVIIVNRRITFENMFDRYTYQSTFGIAMFVVGLVYQIIHQPKIRSALFLILIGIAIFTHLANGIHFKKFWEMQRSLWWQLAWRAPDIKKDTTLVIFTPQEYFFAEAYEIWSPANIIYNPVAGPLKITAELPNNETLPMMYFQKTIGRQIRRVEYTVDFKQMLVLSMPDSEVCLHALDGNRPEISDFDDAAARMIHSQSKISLVDITSDIHIPQSSIFGQEPTHDWCYYFQKASLARQQQNWGEVVRLTEEALKLDLMPKDLSEWMPFYEGSAMAHRLDLANEIGALIRHDQPFLWGYCDYYYKNKDSAQKDKMEAYLVMNLCGT